MLLAGCNPDPMPPGAPTAIARIAEINSEAGDLVRQARKNLKADSAELKKAKELHDIARRKFIGWRDAVAYAIVTGNSIDNSSEYTKISSDAAKSFDEFRVYVNSKNIRMSVSRTSYTPAAVEEIVIVIVKSGIEIWKGYREDVRAGREFNKEQFLKIVVFSSWDEIKN